MSASNEGEEKQSEDPPNQNKENQNKDGDPANSQKENDEQKNGQDIAQNIKDPAPGTSRGYQGLAAITAMDNTTIKIKISAANNDVNLSDSSYNEQPSQDVNATRTAVAMEFVGEILANPTAAVSLVEGLMHTWSERILRSKSSA